ncbi:MAG: hypothetical protein ACRDSR_21370 [Pseudonocardiaceae bacterium]
MNYAHPSSALKLYRVGRGGSLTQRLRLAATVWYAAADATTTDLDAHLPCLLRTLIDHANEDITSPLPGLIQGHAGVALTLHTITAETPSSWPACLLIN